MLITVGDKTFGFGQYARDLPTNPDAYGAKLLTDAEAKALSDGLRKEGWETFWSRIPTERIVFLVGEKWRQDVTLKNYGDQKLQVREIKR
jgi:hypothetical protein